MRIYPRFLRLINPCVVETQESLDGLPLASGSSCGRAPLAGLPGRPLGRLQHSGRLQHPGRLHHAGQLRHAERLQHPAALHAVLRPQHPAEAALPEIITKLPR
eukprot:1099610-Prorocentrum_minimum.AAC.1